LTETWYYGLNSAPILSDHRSRTLQFEFTDNTHASADMGPICVVLDDYSRPLTAAGFTQRLIVAILTDKDLAAGAELPPGRLARSDQWSFLRDNVGVTVYLRGKSHMRDTQRCVSMVSIWARM